MDLIPLTARDHLCDMCMLVSLLYPVTDMICLSHLRLNAKAPAMRREDESSLTQDAMDRAVRSYNRRKQAALREGSPRQDN